MKRILSLIVCVLFFCVANKAKAATQTFDRNDPVANDVLRSLRQPPSQPFDEREKKLPKIDIEKEKKPEQAVSGDKIVFSTFVLKGSTLLLKNEVESVVKPFIGVKMSLPELQALAGSITKLYVNKGFATSYCFIPPQKIEEGKVVFQCVETKVGKLIIKNAEEYNEKLFLRFIRPLRDKPLNVNELNERLKSLSLMPTFIASVEIKRTEQVDVVDLQIDLKEKPLSSSELYVDNFGSRFSGRERFGATYNIVNPTGFGDVVNLNAISSMNLQLNHSFTVGYKRLVNKQGGLLSLLYSYNDNEVPADKTTGNLRVNGGSNNIAVNYKHPLLIDNRFVLTGNVQYEYKDVTSKTLALAVPNTTTNTVSDILIFDKEDKTHVFSLGADVEFVDPIGGWNVFAFSLMRGVEGFFNGMRNRDTTWTATIPATGTIREGVVPDFTLFTANYYRRQFLSLKEYKVENIFNVYGQYSWNRLPSAYTFADGDSGCHTMLELRFPVIGEALKVSLAHNFETYFNSPKSKNLVGLSSESATWLTSGILGHFESFNVDYSLSYSKGLTGTHGNWDDYRHLNKVNFFLTKRF